MSKKIIDFCKYNEHCNLYSNVFESAIHKAFSEEQLIIDDLTLDFSGLNFIDVATLTNISSFVQSFLEEKKNLIKLILPKNKKVYTFLKYWDFKSAFENSTENLYDFNSCLEGENLDFYKKFFSISDSEDLSNLDEFNKTFFSNTGLNIALEKLFRFKQNGSKENNFFGLKNFILNQETISENKEILLGEVNRWEQGDIEAVINNVIEKTEKGNFKRYVSSRVISESVSNAISHPNGTLFQTASRFYKPFFYPQGKNEFSIVFWDNGKSMIQTLSDAHTDLKNIKAELKTGTIFPKFNLKIRNAQKDILHELVINTDPIQYADFQENYFDKYFSIYKEPFVFLATFFPGVSSKANQNEDNTGYGLYELFMAVIENFNGKIVARSGKHRLVMQKSDLPFTYNVDIREVLSPIKDKPFKGNLISIYLPIIERNFN